MKVTLIVSAITVATLGMLYIVAQPTHAQDEHTAATNSFGKTSALSVVHGPKEL